MSELDLVTREIRFEDTQPHLPLRVSDLSEEDYVRVNFYRKMYEIGLESLIFNNADLSLIINEKMLIGTDPHKLRQTLVDEHHQAQGKFDTWWKSSFRLSSEPSTFKDQHVSDMIEFYKNKLREIQIYLK